MNLNHFFDIITYAPTFVLIFSTSVVVYKYHGLDNITKLLGYYLIGSLIISLVAYFLGKFLGNNLFLFFVLTLLELFVFMKLYYSLIKKKRLVISLAIFGTVLTLADSIYIKAYDVKLFQPYSKILATLLIVVLALIYFFELIKDEEKLYKDETHYLSLNSMTLCFFAIQFLAFLPLNFLVNADRKMADYVFVSNAIVLIIFYGYLTHFIWKHGKSLKQ
ncbi:hypothetical protein [Kordia sp.]|uniref:hypothetical protein n=1 Tax=Kordia sp. TaxID=1965332 RepID=UPI003B591389